MLCSRSSTLPSNLIHLSTFQIQTQQSQLLGKSSEANVSCILILVLTGFTLCTVVQRYILIFVHHSFQPHQLCIALIVYFLYRCCPDDSIDTPSFSASSILAIPSASVLGSWLILSQRTTSVINDSILSHVTTDSR